MAKVSARKHLVSNPEAPRDESCSVQLNSGALCPRQPIPLAPFPICMDHAIKASAHLMAVHRLEAEQRRAGEPPRQDPPGVVYYLYLDGLIKIGHTTHLPTRLNSYPPQTQLLASEPGTLADEKRCHAQFAAQLAARKEWFTPCAELWDHVRKLRDAQTSAQ